jgi:hypothetical protein
MLQNSASGERDSQCFLTEGLNPLKPNGNYLYHRLLQSITLYFVYMDLVRLLV